MSAKRSKEYWRDRAKRMETYYNEAAAQRSQALADLDREATEVELLRTVIVRMIRGNGLAVSYRDICWETYSGSGPLTPELLAAVDRAISHDIAHDPATTVDDIAAGLGAVPLEDLPPDAQERGRVRIAQAAVMGNHRNAATESLRDCPWPDGGCTCATPGLTHPTGARRQEAIDEVDVNVTLADAANVIDQVRDHLLDPDRPLSLGALALLLGSVLPRIEYQAGCEATIYAALHHVTMKHAIADVLSTAPGGDDWPTATADAVLDTLRHHIPKLTATMQKDQ